VLSPTVRVIGDVLSECVRTQGESKLGPTSPIPLATNGVLIIDYFPPARTLLNQGTAIWIGLQPNLSFTHSESRDDLKDNFILTQKTTAASVSYSAFQASTYIGTFSEDSNPLPTVDFKYLRFSYYIQLCEVRGLVFCNVCSHAHGTHR
jgi:hypothetical protein